MEKERDDYIRGDNYSRDDERQSSRNGSYEREYTTRIGQLQLKVPRTRGGDFSPSLFETYQRNEKTLITAILEMYIQGVLTRKATKVIEEHCGLTVSKSFVSSLTSELDSMVTAFLNRPLDKKYPFILGDILCIKIRDNHRVVSKALHAILGINEKGTPKLLSFAIYESESKEMYGNLLEVHLQVCHGSNAKSTL